MLHGGGVRVEVDASPSAIAEERASHTRARRGRNKRRRCGRVS